VDFTPITDLLGTALLGGIASIGAAKLLALGTMKAWNYAKLVVSK
jgi:hypothetical protein